MLGAAVLGAGGAVLGLPGAAGNGGAGHDGGHPAVHVGGPADGGVPDADTRYVGDRVEGSGRGIPDDDAEVTGPGPGPGARC